jgi:large subunit ribosomal protein L21
LKIIWQKLLVIKCKTILLHPKILGIMFAVVKIAGQQFRVQEGQSLYVPHLSGKTGDKIELSEVLLVDRDGIVESGAGLKATIQAEIVSELVQGDKVIAFKMKRRKGFRKKHGHRTHYTRIKVNSIV